MASFRPLLIRLFAALLFIQSGAAAAHCLRGMAAGEGVLVEICSADGMRLMRLDGETAPEPGTGSGFCPVCHGPPSVALPAPPILATPAWADAPFVWNAHGADFPCPAARAPPYLTRAPPVIAA